MRTLDVVSSKVLFTFTTPHCWRNWQSLLHNSLRILDRAPSLLGCPIIPTLPRPHNHFPETHRLPGPQRITILLILPILPRRLIRRPPGTFTGASSTIVMVQWPAPLTPTGIAPSTDTIARSRILRALPLLIKWAGRNDYGEVYLDDGVEILVLTQGFDDADDVEDYAKSGEGEARRLGRSVGGALFGGYGFARGGGPLLSMGSVVEMVGGGWEFCARWTGKRSGLETYSGGL